MPDANDPPRRTPCCNYAFWPPDLGPIYWNPGNDAVQCHNCGHAFDARGVERVVEQKTFSRELREIINR